MKIIITERQFDIIKEAKNKPVVQPTSLKNFFVDNPNFEYIFLVKEDDGVVIFKLNRNVTPVRIKNITKGSTYFNFSGDFYQNNILFGNSFKVYYDLSEKVDKATNKITPKQGKWSETIGNLKKIELHDSANKLMDSMELDIKEPEQKLNIDDLANKFNIDINRLAVNQDFKITANNSYEGTLLKKADNVLTFELINTRPNSMTYVCELNLNHNPTPFKVNENAIFINAYKFMESKTAIDKIYQDDIKFNKKQFSINNIKAFELLGVPKDNTTPEPELKPVEVPKNEPQKDSKPKEDNSKEDIEAKRHAKAVYDNIMNDPNLKQAFFKQPKLWGLIKVGDPVGIVPAERILKNYTFNKAKKEVGVDGVKFKPNNTILFEVMDNDIVIELANNFTLEKGLSYEAVVRHPEIGVKKIELIHKDVNPKLEFMMTLIKEDDEVDTYHVILTKKVTSAGGSITYPKSEMGRIKIESYNQR